MGRNPISHTLAIKALKEEIPHSLDYRRDGFKGKSRVKQSTGENRATLGAGLVSVSGVLVLGVSDLGLSY